MFKRLMTKEDRAAYRAAIIPKDACKVTSKEADVVFYLYEGHKPCSMCFIGSAGKPAWRYHFRSEAERARRIASQIEACKAREKAMAERKVSASQPCKIEVGSILVTSWGYDQTNREFFKVIDKKGKQTLIVQEVEQISANTGNEPAMTGKSLPGEAFAKNSKPYTIRVSHGNHVKIEGHYASVWDGLPVSWTAYA
jgi:hypothetical protein